MLETLVREPQIQNSCDNRTWISLLGILGKKQDRQISFFTTDEEFLHERWIHGDITIYTITPKEVSIRFLENASLAKMDRPVIFFEREAFFIPIFGKSQYSETYIPTELLANLENNDGNYVDLIDNLID